VAKPLRFRHSVETWSESRIRREVLSDLDDNLGADAVAPRSEITGGYRRHRFEMDNGDVALLARDDDGAYWIGNTETPSALWRTDKFGWEEVPYPVARWAQRELLADLSEAAPWLEPYPHLAWFFLPVLMSKDGRHTTREFFRDHAAGFPEADRDTALRYYEEFLRTGVLDPYRETMAGKLGTSEYLDLTRMRAAMAEFTAARLLSESGYDVVPEVEVTTGHFLDFRTDPEDSQRRTLIEVTRPQPPTQRNASTPAAALRETVANKATGQLSRHDGTVLFVDCSSFPDDEWRALRSERPGMRHRPAVVYRARPDGRLEGYTHGSVPLSLEAADLED
jgi:hypothetical protein